MSSKSYVLLLIIINYNYFLINEVVDHKIKTSWNSGMGITWGFFGATLFLIGIASMYYNFYFLFYFIFSKNFIRNYSFRTDIFFAVLLTAFVFVHGSKTFMKYNNERKTIVETWCQMPKHMRVFFHSFLEAYYTSVCFFLYYFE